jgi:hypothetical protein
LIAVYASNRGKSYAKKFQLIERNGTCYPEKHPPTIGAKGKADLLFMGTIPRLSHNYVLDWANTDLTTLTTLSANRDQYGHGYLESFASPDPDRREEHYKPL